MQSAHITVQRCGCLAVPEEMAAWLGMLPGAVVALDLDEAQEAITLRVIEQPPAQFTPDRPACLFVP